MTVVLFAAIGAGGRVLAAPGSACEAPAAAYPTFCSIPPAPTGVARPAAVHADVIETRLAGRALVEASAPSTFTLDGTEAFRGRAITETAPPPPMTTPSEADSEAFAKAARATAIPPKHPR